MDKKPKITFLDDTPQSDKNLFRRGGSAKSERKESGNWIQEAVKKPGALHKELKIPEDKKIPLKKIEKAEHSKNPLLRKRANLADTLRKIRKK